MTAAAPTVESARALQRTIREHVDEMEQERRLPKPVVRELLDAGVFGMLVPRSMGGHEV